IDAVARGFHNVNEVAVSERRVEAVDAKHADASAEIEFAEGADAVGACGGLLFWRDGGFQIETDGVGGAAGRPFDHGPARGGHEQHGADRTGHASSRRTSSVCWPSDGTAPIAGRTWPRL